MLIIELYPLRCVLKWFDTVYIVNDHATVGILQITRNKTFESLLTGCVPQLQSISFILVNNIPNQEINANGGLNKWEKYIISSLKPIIYKSINNRSLADMLIAQQNNFIFDFAPHSHWWHTHELVFSIYYKNV